MKSKYVIHGILLLAIILQYFPCQAQDTAYYGVTPRYLYYDLPENCECKVLCIGGVSCNSGEKIATVFNMDGRHVDSIYGIAFPPFASAHQDGTIDPYVFKLFVYEFLDSLHLRKVDSLEYLYSSEFVAGVDWNLMSFANLGLDRCAYPYQCDIWNYPRMMWNLYFSRPYHPTGTFLIGFQHFNHLGTAGAYTYSMGLPLMDTTPNGLVFENYDYGSCAVKGGVLAIDDNDSIMYPLGLSFNLNNDSVDNCQYYSALGQGFYPIIQPPTVSDSVPVCAGVDGFRLGVVMDDMVIFYWNQGSDGHYQCSLGPADSEPEDNALVDFVDGQNFLRYTDLPDGEYKAWVRRECFHDCYFHRDSTYYSDWSEPIAFRVGDPPDDTVSVGNVLATNDITMVPNPATLQVTVRSAVRMATVTLTDMSGREVLRREVHAEQVVLDISTLPKGVYLTTIVTSQATTTKRLVVN